MATSVFFFFALSDVLASEVGYTGRTVNQKRLAPDSLIYLVPTTLPVGFSWAMFFCQDVTDHWTLSGSADYPLFVCRDHSTPPLLGSKHGVGGRLVSVGRMLTILGYCLAAQAARTFILHVSLRVNKESVSMFTTYPAPRRVPIFSIMKFLQTTRIAVERANGYHAFDHSRGRSLRAVALAGERRSSSMVTSLSCHSATVVLSRSLPPASNLRGRPTWHQGSHGQLCGWNRDHSVEFSVFSAASGVCSGWMSASVRMRQKKRVRVRGLREGCRELASEVGRVSERTRFKRSSRCIRASRMRSVPSRQMSVWKCSSSDENEVPLARRESCAGFLEVSLQKFLNPSEWTLAAYGGFFREENIIGLEASSILYPVWYAESSYPLGRRFFLTI